MDQEVSVVYFLDLGDRLQDSNLNFLSIICYSKHGRVLPVHGLHLFVLDVVIRRVAEPDNIGALGLVLQAVGILDGFRDAEVGWVGGLFEAVNDKHFGAVDLCSGAIGYT